jgi:hypothetical protein
MHRGRGVAGPPFLCAYSPDLVMPGDWLAITVRASMQGPSLCGAASI